MRHTSSQGLADPVPLLPQRVVEPPLLGTLIPPAGLTNRSTPSLSAALLAAVPPAAIAVRAHPDQLLAPVAYEHSAVAGPRAALPAGRAAACMSVLEDLYLPHGAAFPVTAAGLAVHQDARCRSSFPGRLSTQRPQPPPSHPNDDDADSLYLETAARSRNPAGSASRRHVVLWWR